MITVTEAQLSAWYGAVFWPLVRVLALIGTAPILSHRAIALRVKVALGVLIALILVPNTPAPPIDTVMSGGGIALLVQNILIGVLLGFGVRLVLAAVEMAGEIIGLQMGLSFAGFFNPASGQTQNAVGGLMSLLAMLMFVAIDGHLMLLAALADSFALFPLQPAAALPLDPMQLASLGTQLFGLALTIALPLVAVMLVTNLVLGVLARVAPQLNIFAVGFPLTILVGLLMLYFFLPYLEPPLRGALEQGLAVPLLHR